MTQDFIESRRAGRRALLIALGWSWADPAAASAMVPWVAREGWEGVRGDED
jgi:hypothetical protein